MAKKKGKVVFNEQVLKQDIQHYAHLFCQAVAEEAKYYIWEFAQYQIGEYYKEYDPIYYSRTGQEERWSFQIFSERFSNGYRGGIVFDNAIIQHNKVPHNLKSGGQLTEDDIEGFVWALGFHGFEHLKYGNVDKWRPIQGEPNRFDKIRQYASGQTIDGFTFPKEKIIGVAKGVARKGQYSMLKFS